MQNKLKKKANGKHFRASLDLKGFGIYKLKSLKT